MNLSRPPHFRRPVIIVAATAAALLLGAGTAFAHVTVNPDTAAPGSYTTLSFRVPNETASASTTKVEIQLPAATPFGFVSAKQTPGWTIDVASTPLAAPVTQGSVTLDEAVTSVTYTATDAGLGPHEFTTFDLLVGPVPEVSSISFAAIQTYNDGEVVSWNEPTPAGGAEPDHPAPVLTVSGAEVTGDDDVAATGAAAVTVTAAQNAASASSAPATDNTDVLARVLGIVGIVVGLFGAGIALGRGATRRSRPASTGGGDHS